MNVQGPRKFNSRLFRKNLFLLLILIGKQTYHKTCYNIIQGCLQILSPTLKSRPDNQEFISESGSQPRSKPTTWCTWAETSFPLKEMEMRTTKTRATDTFTPAISTVLVASKLKKKKGLSLSISLSSTAKEREFVRCSGS